MATNRRGRRTRKAILQAAREQIGRHGVSVPLEDIAASAGTTRMTVWRHFPGREALIRAVVMADSAVLRERLDVVLGSEAPAEERLRDAIVETVRFVRDSPWLRRILQETNPGANWQSIDPEDTFLSQVRTYFTVHLERIARERTLRSSVEHTLDWLLRQMFLFISVPSARGRDMEVVVEDVETFLLPAMFTERDQSK